MLRCARNDVVGVAIHFKHRIQVCLLAAGGARGFACRSPSRMREQGMPDARCTRGLVCEVVQKSCTRAYRAAENIRHSLRNGSTAYDALAPENLALLSPSPLRNLAGQPGRAFRTSASLDANPEAVRPTRLRRTLSTARQHVPKTAHGVYPALQSFSAHDAAASTASHPNVR